MTGNRVEELEGEVQELRATVSGLTDELVETKERLRLIEDHFGPELDDILGGKTNRAAARSEPSGSPRREQSQETVDASVAAVDEEPDREPESAADAADESADEAKAPEEETEEESAGSDDIIVA